MTDKRICPECGDTGYQTSEPLPCIKGCKPPEPETKPQHSPESGGDSSPEPEGPITQAHIDAAMCSQEEADELRAQGVTVFPEADPETIVLPTAEAPERIYFDPTSLYLTSQPNGPGDNRVEYVRADLHRDTQHEITQLRNHMEDMRNSQGRKVAALERRLAKHE